MGWFFMWLALGSEAVVSLDMDWCESTSYRSFWINFDCLCVLPLPLCAPAKNHLLQCIIYRVFVVVLYWAIGWFSSISFDSLTAHSFGWHNTWCDLLRWTDYFIVWHCKINNFLRDWTKITNIDKGLSKRQPHTKKIGTTTTKKNRRKVEKIWE